MNIQKTAIIRFFARFGIFLIIFAGMEVILWNSLNSMNVWEKVAVYGLTGSLGSLIIFFGEKIFFGLRDTAR